VDQPAQSFAGRGVTTSGKLDALASFATIATLATVWWALAGCAGGGGGGGGSGGSPAVLPLSFSTAAVPPADSGVAYTAQIQAAGGLPPYRFALDPAGAPLPSGLSLSSTGLLAGTPVAPGAASMRVRLSDAAGGEPLTRTFDVFVDPPLEVTVRATAPEPLRAGETVDIDVRGGARPYTARLAVDTSGARLEQPAETRFRYVPGASAAAVADQVEVADARGRRVGVDFDLDDGPMAGFRPSFGETDCWLVRFDARRDPSNPYRSDLERELARFGLRTDGAHDPGGIHDELALALVKRTVLGHVQRFFLGHADGGRDAASLRVSFFAAPEGGIAPPDGAAFVAGPMTYNVMEVAWQPRDGVLGRAFLDAPANGNVESDAGVMAGGLALGVDVAESSDYYGQVYGPGLAGAPIGSADVALLRDLHSGLPPSGPRAQAIHATVDSFAYRLGQVIAHEVGHSVGIAHNAAPGSLLYSIVYFTGPPPAFLPGEVAQLAGALPGPGRGGAGAALRPGTPPTPAYLPVVEVRVDGAGRVACGCGARLDGGR